MRYTYGIYIYTIMYYLVHVSHNIQYTHTCTLHYTCTHLCLHLRDDGLRCLPVLTSVCVGGDEEATLSYLNTAH